MPRAKSTSNSAAKTSKIAHAQSVTAAIQDAKIRAQAFSLQRQISMRQIPAKKTPEQLGPILLDWFKQNIEKPGKQLGNVTDIWLSMVPPQLCAKTRLASLTRGVLHVLTSNAVLAAELNIHLRQGLLTRLQNASKGAVYRVKITISSQL